MSIQRICRCRQVLSVIACLACIYTIVVYWSMSREQARHVVLESLPEHEGFSSLVLVANPPVMHTTQTRNIFESSPKNPTENNTSVAEVKKALPANIRIVARVRDHIEEVVLEDGRHNTVLLLRPDEPQGDFTLKHISRDRVDILYRGELYQLRIPNAS